MTGIRERERYQINDERKRERLTRSLGWRRMKEEDDSRERERRRRPRGCRRRIHCEGSETENHLHRFHSFFVFGSPFPSVCFSQATEKMMKYILVLFTFGYQILYPKIWTILRYIFLHLSCGLRFRLEFIYYIRYFIGSSLSIIF